MSAPRGPPVPLCCLIRPSRSWPRAGRGTRTIGARCTRVRNFRVLTRTPLSCHVASHRRLAHGLWILLFLSHTTPELQANGSPVYLARAVHARLITRRRVSQPGQAGTQRRQRFQFGSARAIRSFPPFLAANQQIFCSDLAVTLSKKVNPIHALSGQIGAMHCAQKFSLPGGDWRRRG
jgi:hypothetical protein